MLKETAKKGGGLYFEADNEAELKAAFAKIGDDILAHTSGSASAATFSTSLLQAGTDLYLTTFNTEHWTGDVIAGRLDAKGRPGGKRWSAAHKLDTASDPDTRVMLTWNSDFSSIKFEERTKLLQRCNIKKIDLKCTKLLHHEHNTINFTFIVQFSKLIEIKLFFYIH